jgi:Rrf2 family protein
LEVVLELSLTRRGDYAIRAAISLARAWEGGELRKIREVATEMALPPAYTPHILNLLVKAGLADSRAGQRGGYRLLRPPEAITLLEVLEAAEGPLWPSRCTLLGGPCHWEEMCALHPAWEQAYKALSETLRAQTLASVLQWDRQLERGEKIERQARHSEPRLTGLQNQRHGIGGQAVS